MKFLAGLSVCTFLATAAYAQKPDDMMTARELGQIVGTADICSYPLDAEKVSEVVSGILAEMEPVSRSAYETGSGAQKNRLQRMSEVERKVTCATQAKLAAKYGILSK